MRCIDLLQKTAGAMLMFAITLAAAIPAAAQQYSDWTTPTAVAAINTAALEGCPFISKDDRTLFFASNRSGGSGAADIWATTREDDVSDWAAPFNLGPILNSSASDVCPTYTISGRYLYFVSARTGGCGGDDIYVSRLADKKDLRSWLPPQNLGCQFNSPQGDITPSIFEAADGTVYLYFSSNRPGGSGGMDIYVSTKQPDGSFGTPVAVTELNTTANDQRPNIRYRDGLEIFFESDRLDTLGSTDLYSSTRATTSSIWSVPADLGGVVNTSAVEGRPSLSFDGTTLYFMSTRQGGSVPDVYVTTRTKLRGDR